MNVNINAQIDTCKRDVKMFLRVQYANSRVCVQTFPCGYAAVQHAQHIYFQTKIIFLRALRIFRCILDHAHDQI